DPIPQGRFEAPEGPRSTRSEDADKEAGEGAALLWTGATPRWCEQCEAGRVRSDCTARTQARNGDVSRVAHHHPALVGGDVVAGYLPASVGSTEASFGESNGIDSGPFGEASPHPVRTWGRSGVASTGTPVPAGRISGAVTRGSLAPGPCQPDLDA